MKTHTRPFRPAARAIASMALAVATLALGGCIAGAIGGIGQQIERGKKLTPRSSRTSPRTSPRASRSM